MIFVNDDWTLLYNFLLHSTLRKCIAHSPFSCVDRTDSIEMSKRQQKISMATGKKKSYTLSEALDYLDNLEVSSSDESKDEDDRKLKSAQIFIQPPVNCNDMNSDIDSGDENVADGDASVLSGNQLLGCAVLEMKLTNAKVVRGNDDEQNKTNDNQDLAPELKKKKKKIKGQAYQ